MSPVPFIWIDPSLCNCAVTGTLLWDGVYAGNGGTSLVSDTRLQRDQALQARVNPIWPLLSLISREEARPRVMKCSCTRPLGERWSSVDLSPVQVPALPGTMIHHMHSSTCLTRLPCDCTEPRQRTVLLSANHHTVVWMNVVFRRCLHYWSFITTQCNNGVPPGHVDSNGVVSQKTLRGQERVRWVLIWVV